MRRAAVAPSVSAILLGSSSPGLQAAALVRAGESSRFPTRCVWPGRAGGRGGQTTDLGSLSIVLPMYNELENIPVAVAECLRVGRQMAGDLEIVIVDDASTDGSGDVADALAATHPEVRVIHHPVNRKLGGALKTGFANASKRWILYIDSDLPIRMDDALAALPLLREGDVVIGWRRSRAESLRREVISWVYNRLIRLLFGLRVRDVNFAFKLFPAELYHKIRLTSEGSFIDAELLLRMQRAGARICEVGLDYYPRVAGVSTLASNAVILTTLREVLAHWLLHGTGRPRP